MRRTSSGCPALPVLESETSVRLLSLARGSQALLWAPTANPIFDVPPRRGCRSSADCLQKPDELRIRVSRPSRGGSDQRLILHAVGLRDVSCAVQTPSCRRRLD